MQVCFYAVDRRLVNDLERGGQHAGEQDVVDDLTRAVHVLKDGQRCAFGLWLGEQTHGDLGDHGEGALRADQQAHQIVAGHVFDALVARVQHAPVCQHSLQRHHIVACDAVFEAARAAGIAGDVAAQGGLADASRIGRVKEPRCLCLGCQVGRDHARLSGRG